MDQFGFGFDLSRCSGCFACVVACMDQNDFKTEGPSFRQVIGYEKGFRGEVEDQEQNEHEGIKHEFSAPPEYVVLGFQGAHSAARWVASL